MQQIKPLEIPKEKHNKDFDVTGSDEFIIMLFDTINIKSPINIHINIVFIIYLLSFCTHCISE